MKHVVITGGSRGLGAALIRDLLASGYRVSTCSRSLTPFLTELQSDPQVSERIFWRPHSVGEAGVADQFLEEAMEWAGADNIYALINNAAITGEGILATFPNVDSARILQVNLVGALEMARAALRYMLKRPGGGRIINISSIIGSRGYTGLAAYSASKAGLDGLTRALAREVGRRQITVNSVAPGYMETDMSSTLGADQLAQIVRRTPMGRLAGTKDVCGVVRFLLSEDAAMITGQTLILDGGITC
jgi:3-oxoacyl-[acyl-carrier protein] reductase